MGYGVKKSFSISDLNMLVNLLGGKADSTKHDLNFFVWPYQQSSRSFHDHDHRAFMGEQSAVDPSYFVSPQFPHLKEIYAAIQAISGQGHDLVYMHVDGATDPAKAISAIVQKKLSPYAGFEKTESGFYSVVTEEGRNDKVTQIVSEMFNVPADGKLHHGKAGNEFLSALATAKFLEEKGVPLAHIAIVAQLTAATWPFQSAEKCEAYPFEDGYMGALANRLAKVNAKHGLGLSEKEIDYATMHAVNIANRDVCAFWGDWVKMAHNGLKLNTEFNPKFRAFSNRDIQDMLAGSGPGFYGMVQSGIIKPENIVHSYKGYMGVPEVTQNFSRHEIIGKINKNIDLAVEYMEAKKVGMAVAAAIATFIGEREAPVPGFVRGELWSSHPKVPVGKTGERDVLDVLVNGRGANTTIGGVKGYEIPQAPISGFIYNITGREGMRELYQQIAKTSSFDSPEDARRFINGVANKIGPENFKVILEELAQVAEHPNRDWAGGENYQRAENIRAVSAKRLVSTETGIGRAQQAGSGS